MVSFYRWVIVCHFLSMIELGFGLGVEGLTSGIPAKQKHHALILHLGCSFDVSEREIFCGGLCVTR